MALLRVRNEADYLASNHTKQSLRPQPSLGAQIEALPLPRERFSPLADSGRFATADDQAHSVDIGAARRFSPNGKVWAPS
jgi:hypothetical protein